MTPFLPFIFKHVVGISMQLNNRRNVFMKFFKLLLLTSFALTFACCNNNSATSVKRTEADAGRKAAKHSNDDSTLTVVLEVVKGDSVVVSNSETQRQYTLSTSKLMQDRECYGSLTQKNNLAVMADLKNKTVNRSVNITELVGLWFFSDGSGNGVRIDEDGAVSNVGEIDDITLRSWCMQNGRMKMTYVLSDGSDYEEKEDEVTIIALSADKFIFVFRGNQYTCGK